MSCFVKRLLRWLVLPGAVLACVDPDEPPLSATVNVVVVDGTLNDLPEPQIVRLNRSQADPKTGRFGSYPLEEARMELLVDSLNVVAFRETAPGKYELPADFRGQPGHRYQLRFALRDGTRYESVPETMQAAPPVERVTARFDPSALPLNAFDGFTAGHEVTVTLNDPADQRNFYRWEWILYEKQYWCRSCYQSVYAVNNILAHRYYYDEENRLHFVSGNQPFEDCFSPLQRRQDFTEVLDSSPPKFSVRGDFYNDYFCRTQCWEILRGYSLELFDDRYTNGGSLSQVVGQIPFYTHAPALVEIRQQALSQEAYQFYKLVQDQTQNNGGLTDTPPVAPIGNVRNVANPRERVVGYFAAAGVATQRHWLDRKDTRGPSLGSRGDPQPPLDLGEELFVALNQRRLSREPPPPYQMNRFPPAILIFGGPPRVPTAVCVPSDSRTPVKPAGWRE